MIPVQKTIRTKIERRKKIYVKMLMKEEI